MSFQDKFKQSEEKKPARQALPNIQIGHAVPLEFNEEDTYEWDLARRRGVGGSDAACIMGMKPYGQTRLQLWEEKTGRTDRDIQGEALRFGHKIEPYIRKWLTLRAADTPAIYGEFEGLIDYPGQMCHPERDWQRGNVDGIIVRDARVSAMLEIKQSTHAHLDKRYTWVDDVMEYHHAQIQHYLEALGLSLCYYVYFEIPAPRDFCWELQKEFIAQDREDEFWLWYIDQGTVTIRKVYRDKEYGEMLTKVESEFWQSVKDDVKPKEFLPAGEIRVEDMILEGALEEYGIVHATIAERTGTPADLRDEKERLKNEIKARAQMLSAAHGDAKKIYVGDQGDYVLWNARGYWVAKPSERKPKTNEIEVPF